MCPTSYLKIDYFSEKCFKQNCVCYCFQKEEAGAGSSLKSSATGSSTATLLLKLLANGDINTYLETLWSKSAAICAGTPGKALDWSLKFRFLDLKKISVFVLDEADVMIATQGHQDQSIRYTALLGLYILHIKIILFSLPFLG